MNKQALTKDVEGESKVN